MTKGMRIMMGVLIVALFLLPVFAFAQPADKEVPLRYTDSSSSGWQSFLERGTVKNFLSISQGYDNNVYLNSAREHDPFTQITYKTTFTSPLCDTMDAILGYEVMSLLYPQEHDVDMIKNGVRIGLDTKLSDAVKLSTSYYFDYIDYPNTGSDDFLDHRMDFVVKQNLPYKMYHSLGYEFMYKDYQERQTRVERVVDFFGFPLNLGVINTGKNRSDIRNSIEYEIGKYFPKDLIKASYQYYYNDSNERYLNFYDHDSYRGSISLTHIFTDKLFLYVSFSDQYRFFRSRMLTTNEGSHERDRTYIASSALFYNLNESLSVGLNYSYRKNDSNEPIEKYTGSLVSLGAYYKF